MRIMARQTGATNFKQNIISLNIGTRIDSLLVNWRRNTPLSRIHPTNIEISIPPIGNSTLDEMLLKRLNRFRRSRGPNESAQREPKNSAIAVQTIHAFERLKRPCSVRKVIEISLIDIVDDNDARKSIKKNNVAQIAPAGIIENIRGSTSNIRVGPSAGDIPKVNTAGKIIIPARIATRVSRPAVAAALRTMFVLSLK